MPSFKNQTGLAPVIIVVAILSLGAILTGGYFTLTQKKPTHTIAQTPTLPIEKVKEINEDEILKMDGVNSVEVGSQDKKPCVVVFTFKETDELHELEDNGLSGYEVQVANITETP